MNTINIISNTAYIMSGPPCSGKSTFLNALVEQGLPKEAIICPDQIRESILGYKSFVDDNGSAKSLYGWYYEGDIVFEIVQKTIKARLNQGLPIFIDATNMTDSIRSTYAEEFQRYQKNFEVLIFNVSPEILNNRMKKREYRFQENQDLSDKYEKLQLTSEYPYQVIHEGDKPLFIDALLSNTNIIAVGDTHGLLEPTKELLAMDGFIYEDKCFKHPTKKVLFLGDVVSRGKNSLELLEIVQNTVRGGHGYMLLGNHEMKLIRAADSLFFTGSAPNDMSISTALVLKELRTYPLEKQQDFFQFLRRLPASVSYRINKDTLDGENFSSGEEQFKIAFGHSPLNYFSPVKSPKEEISYGSMPYSFDVQEGYEKNFLMGNNEYVYIHARNPNSNKINASSIHSICDIESFGGNLVSFDLNKYLNLVKENDFILSPDLFSAVTKKVSSNFHFLEEHKLKIGLKNSISQLNQNNFFDKADSGETHTSPTGLKMYIKKDKKSHPTENVLLSKCNGLVVDSAGCIIVNPISDYKTTSDLDNSENVYAINHYPSDIFYVYRDPYSGQISVSSPRSFKAFKEDLLFVQEHLEKFETFFSKNNVTLGFQYHYPDNKIEHLLVHAQKNSMKSSPYSEERLDIVAKELSLVRPDYKVTNMAEVREKSKHTQGIGYLVRKINSTEEILKIDSNLILFHNLSKHLLSDKDIKFFFAKPELFMEKNLPEDAHEAAMTIHKKFKLKEFLDLTDDEKKHVIFNNIRPTPQNKFKP